MLLIGMTGCSLEHHILVKMNEDSYTIDYKEIKDVDFIPFLYPGNFHEWTKIDSGETEIHYNKRFNYSDQFTALFTLNNQLDVNDMINDSILTLIRDIDIVLKQPHKITMSDYFIINRYQFEWVFKNRRVDNNYDKLVNYYSGFMDDAQSIIDGKDIEQNKDEEISKIFNQLIDFFYTESLMHVEWNQRNIYLNGLSKWKDKSEIADLINEKKIGIDGEQLNKILDASKDYLISTVDKTYIPNINKIWRELKLEVYTTLFLLFNDFYIDINVPDYNMIYHNADSAYGNKLLYNVEIDKFMNEDYHIFSTSMKINKIKSAFMLFILVLSGFILIRKYSKN